MNCEQFQLPIMMYTILQNYTNMLVGIHGIYTSEVVVVVFLFLWLLS